MNKNKVTRKVMIVAAVAALWIAQIACDSSENPCANGSACGITSPAGEVQQMIQNAVDDNPCDNALGGC